MKLSSLLPLIGVLIFLYLLRGIDIGKVAVNLARVNPYLFLASLALIFITIVLKALRWKKIIASYGIDFPLGRCTKVWMIGFSISLITPGKIGDFAKSYYLKGKEGIGKSLTTVMVERIIDVVIIFILAILGLAAFTAIYVGGGFLLSAVSIIFLLFIAGIMAFSRKSLSYRLLSPFYRRFAPVKYKERVKLIYHDFYSGVDIIMSNKRSLAVPIIITLIAWFASVFQAFVLAAGMGLQIPYSFLLMVLPIVILLLVLPVSVSGIGTREAALVFFLSFIGIQAEAAISFSLMQLLIEYIGAAPGFYLWHRNPIKLRPI